RCPGYADLTPAVLQERVSWARPQAVRREGEASREATNVTVRVGVSEQAPARSAEHEAERILPLALRPLQQQSRVVSLAEAVSAASLAETVKKLESYGTRNTFTLAGRQAMLDLKERFAELAQGRTDVTVELVEHDYCLMMLEFFKAQSEELAKED